VSEQTGDLLMAAARRVRREYAEALAEFGTTPSQSRALRVVAAEEPVRPSVLAEALRIAPRSATEVADALEEHGWVRRAPDPTDRRATSLTVTDEGRRVLGHMDDARRSAGERVLGALADSDRRTLDRILRTLGEHS
jgi:DNA-binding MarR family transcriptional regulator